VALELRRAVPSSAEVASDLMARLLAAVDRQLDRSASLGWCRLQHASGFGGAVTAARRAARLAAAGGAGGRIAQYETMGTHEVLLGLADDVLTAFEDLVVGPVVDHDARHGSDLVATLEEFLGRNCAVQSTAQALGIHVNTLRYRLATIERLTGRDLRSMPQKVDLFLALRSRADRRRAAR
jgi:DNA-binding PucR family transcriptional regulator